MKRIFALTLAALLLLTAVGCTKKDAAAGGVEGSTSQIIDKIYANHKALELDVGTMDLDLADDNAVSYNTGLKTGEKIRQASVSEAMMGQAYSLVVLRVKDAAEAPEIAQEVYDNINTRKWICVEADTKTVMYAGDVVVLFMIDSEFGDVATVESIQEAFRAVCGGSMTIVG